MSARQWRYLGGVGSGGRGVLSSVHPCVMVTAAHLPAFPARAHEAVAEPTQPVTAEQLVTLTQTGREHLDVVGHKS